MNMVVKDLPMTELMDKLMERPEVVTNIDKAIAIMERVIARGDRLDMSDWQRRLYGEAVIYEDQLSACGMPACLGGWIGVSQEFRSSGGCIRETGSPALFRDGMAFSGSEAIAKWLGISGREAGCLCLTGFGNGGCAYYSAVDNGKMHPDDITATHVIAALTRLKETGTCIVSI